MSKTLKVFFITLLMLVSSSSVMATDFGSGGGDFGAGNSTSVQKKATSSNLSLSIKIENPIADTDILSLIDRIVGFVLKIGIPIIALFLLWAGFRYVMARGNPKEITDAHRNLGHVLLGTAIFLGAYTVAKAVIATIQSILN